MRRGVVLGVAVVWSAKWGGAVVGREVVFFFVVGFLW